MAWSNSPACRFPGATITATMGDKKMVAVTDPHGVYSFPDLADGVWNLQVEMLCFSPLKMEVAVAPNSPSPEWELKLLPFDEIKAVGARRPRRRRLSRRQPRRLPLPRRRRPGCRPSRRAWSPRRRRRRKVPRPPRRRRRCRNGDGQRAARFSARRFERFRRRPPAAADQPAAGGVDEATPATNGDALLVNGSVSNGVERRAIGNFRKGPGSGYRGDVSSILDNSALDARIFSVTGQDTPEVGLQSREIRVHRSAGR